MEKAFKDLIAHLKAIHASDERAVRERIDNDWEPIYDYLYGYRHLYADGLHLKNLVERVKAFRGVNKNYNERLQMAVMDIDKWVHGAAGGRRRSRRVKRRVTKKRRHHKKRVTRRQH